MNTKEAWQSGRPIFSRLPNIYKENPLADNLVIYWEDVLVDAKNIVDDLPRQLNPLLCDANWLDFLASLCGFTGDYWDKEWAEESKRVLLANSYSFIWPNKGSRQALSFILNALFIEHKIYVEGAWVIGTSQLGIDQLGSSNWTYQILLPLKYNLEGVEFSLANKINRLYGPLWCKSEVIHDYL
jgi:phage tail-like protein